MTVEAHVSLSLRGDSWDEVRSAIGQGMRAYDIERVNLGAGEAVVGMDCVLSADAEEMAAALDVLDQRDDCIVVSAPSSVRGQWWARSGGVVAASGLFYRLRVHWDPDTEHDRSGRIGMDSGLERWLRRDGVEGAEYEIADSEIALLGGIGIIEDDFAEAGQHVVIEVVRA